MKTYEEVYNQNWEEDKEKLSERRKALIKQLETEVRAEQKRRQPRARTKFKDLPVEVYQEIVKNIRESGEYLAVIAEEARIEGLETARKARLEEMAGDVEPMPCESMNLLDTISSHPFTSQGYGALKYAKGVLEPFSDYLEAQGFETHIRRTNYKASEGRFGCPAADFELWANCPEWMFDALKHRVTIEDAFKSWNKRQLNPLVYHPLARAILDTIGEM